MIREQVIKQYVLSKKSQEQEEKTRIYTFYVHPKANKFQIKQAIRNIYKVKVKKIRTCREKPVKQKVSLLRKFPGKFYTKLRKKAFIQLVSGYKLG
ncbi:50S ribosomal protein L23 [endosymbiont GvMRE of Glomus versiforme]|uniref:50S ribosomal protein L23 n=1 Tax=endosymbiont GvMRE of Glomus versiforme TaxID=2039283 RepID=UPI000ED8D9E3|nr:50S ribosomal protein L23 [endosymbiont GvMRE of Glomus versiforme]RHZ36377.1 50S ribosomal protein L23 [endosymbiont GvMRE of Glomus versiforme]